MLWWVFGAALAAEPQVSIGDDGLLHGAMVIEAPPEAVLAVLEDAERMAGWSKDVLAFDPVGEPAGGCQVYAGKTRGLWSPLTYKTKRCRTTEGFRDTLVESDSFSVMSSEWKVRARGDHTAVDYTGDLELSFPVPKKMLSTTRIKSMTQTFTKLDEAARAQATP